MDNPISFYRVYLKEPIRKFLGINLKHKKIYVFKVKNRTYLSTNAIPKTAKYKKLTAKIGMYSWFIDVPETYLEYVPATYKLLNTRGKVLELIPSEK